MSDAASLLLAGTGIVIGSSVSWYITWLYYRKSGVDLDSALKPLANDQSKLLQATNALGRMLEQAGIGKPTFDESGNLTGIIIFGKAHITLNHATMKASGSIAPPSQYDRQHEQPTPEVPGGDAQ